MDHRRWPAGLFVGLLFAAASVVVLFAAIHLQPAQAARWSLIGIAGVVGAIGVAATGALDLSRRVRTNRRPAALVAAGGFAVLAATLVTDGVLLYAQHDVIAQTPYLVLGGLAVAGIGLGLAAGSVPFATGLAALAVFVVPLPQLACLASDALQVGSAVAWAALALAAVAMASRASAEPAERQSLAVVGLRRAAVGMWIRLGAATLLASAIYFEPIRYHTSVAGAFAGAVSMVLVATGLVRVASGANADMPRIRLHLAAALGLTSAAVWCAQALFVYKRFGAPQPTWSIAPAVIAAAAILVLLSALLRMSYTACDEKLQRHTRTAISLFVPLTLVALLLLSIGTPKSMHDFGPIYAHAFGNTFNTAALVMAASVCTKFASLLDVRAPLPTATLRSPDQG